jgi:prevent-host-death family protein
MEKINIADAKSRFSELLSRASAGERFIIQRREKPLAALISIEALDQMERASQTGRRIAQALGQSAELLEKIEAGKVHPAMAAFGLWKDDPDFESMNATILSNRQRSSERQEVDL